MMMRVIRCCRVVVVFALLMLGGADISEGAVVDVVGDDDNFGYGIGAPIPCEYFDNAGAGDLGVFDRESQGPNVRSWTHDFTDMPDFGPGFVARSVRLEVREIFSDGLQAASTIIIDGRTFPFTSNGVSLCGEPLIQVFTFAGTAAEFADDGVVNVAMFENGDDIALDYARLTVIACDHDGLVESGEGCDDGNLSIGDGCDDNCQVEPCYACTGQPSSCTTVVDGSPCDDALFCNGTGTCAGGDCVALTGDPCAGGAECHNVCSEDRDTCDLPANAPCLDDGNPCTTDTCNGLGVCVHPNADLVSCSDGLACNGSDLCLNGACSLHPNNPCAGNVCNDRCSDTTFQCLPSTSGTACFEDGNECTVDQCNEAGTCVHEPIVGCSTRSPTPTRTRTLTRTPSATRTVTSNGTPTLTPINTPTPTPATAPAVLVLRRVRLKADTREGSGQPNGSASGRGEVNANSPFDGLAEEILGSGVALRIAGGGGVELTLGWQPSHCAASGSAKGSRITCTVEDAAGRRVLKLRPTSTPNVYTLRFSAKHLPIPAPRSAAPVRVVLITPTLARPDDIYACSVKGAQAHVSLCVESGVVPSPTAAPPLGIRVFSVARPGSAITTTALANFDVTTDDWSPSILRLNAGAPDVDGVAALELVDDVIIGAKIIDGSTFCIKIFAAGSHGTIDCDGGSAYDVVDIYDSNGSGPSGEYRKLSGLGSDAGPGAATLFAGWNAFNLPRGTTVNDCQSQFYFQGQPYGFTTAMATGTFANPVQGGTVSQSAQGQNFDCATWTQENGPGKLLRPMLPTDTIVGDAANVLAIADAASSEPPPAPTLTLPPTSTPMVTRTRTSTPSPTPTFTTAIVSPTPTFPFPLSVCRFGGTPADALVLNIAGATFPSVPIQGEIGMGCTADDGSPSRECGCVVRSIDPVSLIGIGFVCIDNGTEGGDFQVCPLGAQLCDAAVKPANIDLFADASIGSCTTNDSCRTQCDTYCGGLPGSHVRFNSGCESRCQGGSRADLACQCDRLGTATCAPGSTLDCPLGSCEGKDNELDVDCHCQCIDDQAGSTSPDGAFSCRLPIGMRIEASTPCDGSDVLVRLQRMCAPFTSEGHVATIINSNEDALSRIDTSSDGSSISCPTFDASPAGMHLVANLPFFDTTIGDLVAQLSLSCHP